MSSLICVNKEKIKVLVLSAALLGLIWNVKKPDVCAVDWKITFSESALAHSGNTHIHGASKNTAGANKKALGHKWLDLRSEHN